MKELLSIVMVMVLLPTGSLMMWILIVLLLRSLQKEDSVMSHIMAIANTGVIPICSLMVTVSIIILESTVLCGVEVTIKEVQLQN